MNRLALRLGVIAIAVAAIVYGCGENSDPAAPEAMATRVAAQSSCGEVIYLAALSPVLAVWDDSLETALGSNLLNDPPAFTDESTADAYLTALVPVLQQWETAINTALGSAVVDTIANFQAGTTPRQAYLTQLSATLVQWKADLEASRGSAFLPAPPVFEPDDNAPEIVCSGDTVITCAGPDGFVYNFDAFAIDDCDPNPVVTVQPPSGSNFPVGTTAVAITATDVFGNTSTCTFNVTVEAAEAPVIVNASANPNLLWPPNHKWRTVAIEINATSACDGQLTKRIVGVTSNEAEDGTGSGSTSPDWIMNGNGSVKLRAERSGNGSGRVYTVHYELEDDFGNIVEGSVDVLVPHDRGHGK
ncbi:MAG TPA: HYR domain-containing protein [Candidatus Krumholzibacteria bacterium]|nr:HYR domain-containing protein [Candidatus Krumholzibacteria bacterium]